MDQWYIERQGKRSAPCTLDKLKKLMATGAVRDDDLVWREGMAAAAPAKTLPEFATGTAAAPPPPAAPPPAPVVAAPPVPVPAATSAAAPVEPTPTAPPAPRRPPAFLTTLNGRLPKPILFGLYGAVGAVLGLLLLGELLFIALKPEELKPHVKIALPKDLTLYPASENKLAVKISRNGFEGLVTVTAVNPPKDVQISKLVLNENATEGELLVRSTGDLEPGTPSITITATADHAEAGSETFKLNLSPVPPSLQVATSPSVAVYAGSRNSFTVKITRDLFEGPVRVEVMDLPDGIVIPMITIPANASEVKMDVTVAKNVTPSLYSLPLEARSLSNHKIRANDTLRLHVEPPPGKLQLAVASQVTVFPGEKNRFKVLISKQDFSASVDVDVEDLPDGVTIPSATIPANKADVELEVSATANAAPGTYPLRVKAKAPDADNVTASLPLQLKVTPPPPTVSIAASPKVALYPEGKAKFGIKIDRQRFTAPVRITVQDQTGGYITGTPIVIPAEQTDGEVEITASKAALRARLPLKGTLQVIASSQDSNGVQARTTVQVEILAPPSGLQLTVSPVVEAYQGGKFRFTIKVARNGFDGPIQLNFSDLPEGVTLETIGGRGRARTFGAGTIPAGVNERTLEGKVSLRTPAQKYTVKVEGTGPTAPDGRTPRDEKEFILDIKVLEASKRPPPIDAVFVLDLTNSMEPQIKGLRDGIGEFLADMKKNELDARVGLVTFRDIEFDNKPPEIVKFNGEPFTSDPTVFSAEVGKLKVGDGGDEPESSLEALALAATLPYRPGALRILLLITDAPPQTKGNALKMPAAIAKLKDGKIEQIHLIINTKDQTVYNQLRAVGKGGFFDLQEASRAGKGFASLLPELSKGIADRLDAAAPDTPLATAPPVPPPSAAAMAPLSEKPPAPEAAPPPRPQAVPTPPPPVAGVATAPEVLPPQPPVTTVPTPPAAETGSLKGLQSTTLISPQHRFRLLAAIALWTAALAGGIGLALVVGQKIYLQQMFPRTPEMTRAVLAGLAAGLAGGLIGQLFFQNIRGAEIFGRVLAWGLLGGLLGAGMSLFVPNLRWQRGFQGGAVGGLLGAIGFAVFTALAGQVLGRWIGAAVLGFFIGMMIALAEMAFRRYWLEVRFGAREIRTFTLGPALLAVGGDERASTVCVSGAPGRALGYTVRGTRVLCEDFTTGRTSDAPPGDQRQLAHAQLTVRSDATATPTGASMQLYSVRDVSLMEGMPLSAEDIPGLEPQGIDGAVALVSRRPNDPKALLLRNRSKQTWTVKDASGERTVTPGASVELSSRCQINFGQVKATLDFNQK